MPFSLDGKNGKDDELLQRNFATVNGVIGERGNFCILTIFVIFCRDKTYSSFLAFSPLV
jgi:hypothetical protein